MSTTAIIITLAVILALGFAVRFVVQNLVTIALFVAILVGGAVLMHSQFATIAKSTASSVADKGVKEGKRLASDASTVLEK